jgi:hypothetical protein
LYGQIKESGREERGAKAGIYPASTLSMAKPLGIFTKSQVNLTQQGFQRVHEFLLQDQSAKLLPRERVSNCLKKRIDKTKHRDVKYNESRKKAHWSNVQRCGSVWTCPVCAKQITEKRRLELSQAVFNWRKNHKGFMLLLTLTFSHSSYESLRSLMDRQKKAYKIFLETTKVKEILRLMGVKHKIRSFEVTYGQNGWHPHFHILMFTDHFFTEYEHTDTLTQLWIKACLKAGLSAPSMKHGLDLRDGTYADQYVSKWGLEHEMTKGHTKKGRHGSFTPFDLLQGSIFDQDFNSRSFKSLYQEYGVSTKGARQLVWSRGLKALLGIEEKTDDELAEETEKDAITMRTVDDFAFSLLCHAQKRHEFLRCLERDWENGCFGTGEADLMLISLVEAEIERLGKV